MSMRNVQSYFDELDRLPFAGLRGAIRILLLVGFLHSVSMSTYTRNEADTNFTIGSHSDHPT